MDSGMCLFCDAFGIIDLDVHQRASNLHACKWIYCILLTMR